MHMRRAHRLRASARTFERRLNQRGSGRGPNADHPHPLAALVKQATETGAMPRSRYAVRFDVEGTLESRDGRRAGDARRPQRARCRKCKGIGALAELLPELARKKRINEPACLEEAPTHFRTERAMSVIGRKPNFDEGLMQDGDGAARRLAPQEIEKLASTRRISAHCRHRHSRAGPAPGKADREPVERKEACGSSDSENDQGSIHGSRSMQWPNLEGPGKGK